MADFYFGNLATGALKRPAPESGLDASNIGSEDSMTFDGGGAYVTQSAATHKEFNMSWGVQDKSAMDFLNDYRNGVNGQGLLYMVDPFAKNAMPAHWANPQLTCNGWPSLVGPGNDPEKAAAALLTNSVTNPAFKAAGASTTLRENLATNPSFEAMGTTVVMRTNAALNPSAEVDLTTWTLWGGNSGAATLSRPTTGGYVGAAFARATWTTAPTTVADINGGIKIAQNITPDMKNFSMYVRSSKGQRLIGVLEAFNAAAPGGVKTSFRGNAVVVQAGVWTRVTVENITLPADTVRVEWNVYAISGTGGTTWAVGDYIDGDAVQIETGTAATGYFDGSTVGTDADFTYAWTGTAGSSTSQERAISVPTAVSANSGVSSAAVIRSTDWAKRGSASIRVIPLGTGRDTAAQVFGSTVNSLGGLVPGKTYTASVTVRTKTVITEPFFNNNWGLSLFFNDSVRGWAVTSNPARANAVNTPGEQRLNLTFTVSPGATWAVIRFYHGSNAGSGESWWDDFVLVEGDNAPESFDGSTPNTADLTYSWTGAANASTSLQKGLAVPGTLVTTGQTLGYRITDSTATDGYAFRSVLMTTGNIGINLVTPYGAPAGTRMSILMRVRASRTMTVKPRIHITQADASVTLPANEWTTIRASVTLAQAADNSYTGLLLTTGNGYQSGDTIDIDWALVTTGDYTGPYFDGSTQFIDGTSGAWVGVADASASTLARTPGNMPNFGAKYTISSAPNTVPDRVLTLMIPDNQDLYLGFTGSAANGGVVRMRTITRDGAYGPVTDLTLLDPLGTTRLNTKVAGSAYRAVQVYLTSTAVGVSSVTLVTAKAVYSLPTVTPVLTGDHTEGEGHTGFRFSEAPTMTYIKAASGRTLVSTAAAFTEIEAWL